jgi:predicted ArsR family transcriptional regulator
VSDLAICRAVADSPFPCVATGEAGQALGLSDRAARERLADLERRGILASRLIGGSRAWWLTDVGLAFVDKREDADEL